MNTRSIKIPVFLTAAIFLVGCSPSPVKYFPNFPLQKSSLGQAVLLQDVFLLEGTATDTAKFDILWNARMADSLINYFSERLRLRDYPLHRSIFASMGMPAGGRMVYSVVSAPEEQSLEVEELPKKRPPFYINAEFDSSSEARRRWKSVCTSLMQTSFTPEVSHTIIADAAELGNRLNVSTIYVFLATGFTVPVGERTREKYVSPNRPIGQVADEKISQASVTLYIIDVTGGELLWSDQTSITGGTVYLGKLYVLIDRIIDHLP